MMASADDERLEALAQESRKIANRLLTMEPGSEPYEKLAAKRAEITDKIAEIEARLED